MTLLRIFAPSRLLAASIGFATLLLSWSAIAGDSPQVTNAVRKDTGAYTASFVRDQGNVTVMEFIGDYDKTLPDGTFNAEARQVVAREFYRQHPDTYDILVVTTQFPIDTANYFAFFHAAKNDVNGIGKTIFDNTFAYNSNGKLRGMIDMASLGHLTTDPLDPKYDFTMVTFAHEFLHQFAAYIMYRKPDGTLGSDLLGQDGVHWSYLMNSHASVLYGSEWTDNGDGTFTATDVEHRYSPLDLYLMGFIPKEQVPPFTIIDAPGVDPTQLPALGATVRGTARTVTIDDVISAMGPRIPDVSTSPKNFRLAFIYLTRPGEPVADAEITKLNTIRTSIGTRFSALTNGVAEINVFTEPTMTATTGAPPGLPPSVSPPATNVNLQLAIQWLKDHQSAADASWADTPSTAIRDSCVAATALQELSPGYSGILTAASWLTSRSTASVDFLSRKLTTLALVNHVAVAPPADLLSYQNGDGGWGAAQGYASNPLDTALALDTLLRRATPVDSAATNALAYLRATQNADGGWGNVAGGTSRTTTTAHVIAVLQADPASSSALASAFTFIAGRQNTDGGFG
ncbi:MAG TPA: prenyltransferase/squalene oxidase repeat-containing protein, partial [Usitatibacter sp.]|nr:prenyltransferase/squalene oxidase repeat-containing protein [Usitatibacter sp.]